MSKFVFLTLALAAFPAFAGPTDDYVACLIGRSAVALQQQQGDKKDSSAAQVVAYKQCKEPKGIDENDAEGLSDYVNISVEAIAGRLSD